MSEIQTVSNTTSSGETADVNPNADLPTRWEVELEFVQSLANLQYLSYIVQNGYLKDEKFINYLSYLTYWRGKEYSKHIVYPDCLHILTLLQNEQFRLEIGNPNLTNALFIDMVDYWKEEIYKDEKSRDILPTGSAVNENDVNELITPQINDQQQHQSTIHQQLQKSMSPTSTEG